MKALVLNYREWEFEDKSGVTVHYLPIAKDDAIVGYPVMKETLSRDIEKKFLRLDVPCVVDLSISLVPSGKGFKSRIVDVTYVKPLDVSKLV